MDDHHTDAAADGAEPNGETPGDGSRADRPLPVSRRRVLAGVGGAGVAFGLLGYGTTVTAQQTEFRLGGELSGWQGQAPASIEGVENPTLELQTGQEYSIVWENLDGQPHNVAIVDGDGNRLVSSEIISEQGATQTVTFTATAEMTEYLCEVHPTSMVGSLSITDAEQTTTTTTTQEPGRAGFFTEGTEVGLRLVADGMTAPTDYAVPDDGSGRQFVTDQTGEVWVVTDQGRRETPFMTVSDRLVTLGEFNGSYASQTQAYDERGLLGIDFHPDFANNGRFYLHYSAPPNEATPEGWDHVEVVSEFTTTEDGSNGDPASERVLLQFQKPQYNHDGGPMAFGPDGYLYVPMGDGGGANDNLYGHVEDWYDANSGGNGQDITENLLGDVHRIDVDAQGDGTPYGIPEDNPFVGTDALDEIYAYGFRNPFGISFDSQGNLFVADAGQNLFEEVDVVEKGGNYGWNVKEGTHCFSTESAADPTAITDCPQNEPNEAPYDGSPLVDPVVEFPHTYQGESVGITVVGGHRYEADAVSGLQGKYVFGAWTTDTAREEPAGRILAATPPADFGQDGGATTTTTTTDNGTETTTETTTTPGTTTTTEGTDDTDPGAVPVDQLWDMEELVVQGGFDYFVRMFGQGPNGEVYVLASQRGVPEGDTGAVFELVPPGEGDGSA
ncbi:glucose/sorbosone dehydrogenase [Halobacterium sp. DL1]|jgi:glucose/arabinose dehydrogenase|nr:glucose/sorbosone dehydrogenase [Halobacterium sp. DL1]